MSGWLEFLNRNARVTLVVGAATAAVFAAGVLGWLTAPV